MVCNVYNIYNVYNLEYKHILYRLPISLTLYDVYCKAYNKQCTLYVKNKECNGSRNGLHTVSVTYSANATLPYTHTLMYE